jgi:hypothetical protein
MMGFRAMNEESVYQADAEDIPSEVSDEALETAAGNEVAAPAPRAADGIWSSSARR